MPKEFDRCLHNVSVVELPSGKYVIREVGSIFTEGDWKPFETISGSFCAVEIARAEVDRMIKNYYMHKNGYVVLETVEVDSIPFELA